MLAVQYDIAGSALYVKARKDRIVAVIGVVGIGYGTGYGGIPYNYIRRFFLGYLAPIRHAEKP